MKNNNKARLAALLAIVSVVVPSRLCAQLVGEPLRLQTVVVSATRHALLIADAPAAMSVITRSQIEQRGADDVLESIRGETGVAVFGRIIGGRKGVSLRGIPCSSSTACVSAPAMA